MDEGLGEALREARRVSGMSFRKFARLAGFSESHLRSAENGHRTVTPEVASAYDRVLCTGGTFLSALAGIRAPATYEADGEADFFTLQPWTSDGTLSVLADVLTGSDVDRRLFVTASGAAATALAGRWNAALDATEPFTATGSRRIPLALVEHIDQRLDHLRHLDDELGSGDLAGLARNDLALAVHLLRTGSYTERTGRYLYALAAEASRQVAWVHFDQHHHATARRYFETSLRASASADDPVTGAYSLSFLAVQCYSTGQARQAVSLLETARRVVSPLGSARMSAMLAARMARACSKAGERRAAMRELHEARTRLERCPDTDEVATLYWVTEGEIEMIAGSCALELGDPAEAIRRFDAAVAADYPGDEQYPRTHAIYMARAAEAHLALHDLDAAVETATHAMRCLGGVDSARSTSTLADLRSKLAVQAGAPVIRDFLEATR